MVAGIAQGFYGRLASSRLTLRATQEYSSQNETETVSEAKTIVQNITKTTAKYQKALQLEGLGEWWFFSGLAVFIISRRSKWNMNLQSDSKENE